jgi:hypothetical protein
MKKLIIGAATVLFITGTVLAQEKAKEKSCSKSNKACCKQPSKTASLRTAKPAKPAQPAQPAKPAAQK